LELLYLRIGQLVFFNSIQKEKTPSLALFFHANHRRTAEDGDYRNAPIARSGEW
jgi:hypothetical protein